MHTRYQLNEVLDSEVDFCSVELVCLEFKGFLFVRLTSL